MARKARSNGEGLAGGEGADLVFPATGWRLWRWPPFWFTLALAALFFLEWDFGRDGGWMPAWTGWIVFLPGIGMVFGAFLAFRRHDTPVCPFRQPRVLMTQGIYAWSRNPIYFGEVLMLAGLALMLEATIGWWVVPVFAGLVEYLFIRPEERLLRSVFGERFVAYEKRTGRWITLPLLQHRD